MELRDVVSLAGALIALGALGLGVYNVWRTRKVAHVVDSLLLDDRRFEVLRTAIDIQSLRTRQETSVANLRYEMRTKIIVLSAAGKSEVQKLIDQADKRIEDLRKDIASDRNLVTEADGLTTVTRPEPALIQSLNAFLGRMKASHSRALLQQAEIDGFISDADNLLAAAQLHTESIR